jgi:predicted dehydrogenase
MTSNSAGELIKFEAYVGRGKREIVQVALAEDHRDPATYFAKAVRTLKLEDFVSAEFHMDVMEILEAVQRSAENGRPVTLPLR